MKRRRRKRGVFGGGADEGDVAVFHVRERVRWARLSGGPSTKTRRRCQMRRCLPGRAPELLTPEGAEVPGRFGAHDDAARAVFPVPGG